jgi:hypothetical protein
LNGIWQITIHTIVYVIEYVLLKRDDDTCNYIDVAIGDHYITVRHESNTECDKEIISVFFRGHGDILDTINVPKNNRIYEIKGK